MGWPTCRGRTGHGFPLVWVVRPPSLLAGDSCLPVRKEVARSHGGRCWLRVRWEENRGPSANRSCKERRQPAENSPAWKKGSSQGALAQPLSFLIMPSVFQLLGVGPLRLVWGKRYWPRSVVMGGLSAGAG